MIKALFDMKKILSFLFVMFVLSSAVFAEDGAISQSNNVETENSVDYFISTFYYQIKKDATRGSGDWLNSLYAQLQLEGSTSSKDYFMHAINQSASSQELIDLFQKEKAKNLSEIDIHNLLKTDEIRLCLVAPCLENPMSYFGHVFLEFYQKDNPLFSYCLSFLGTTDLPQWEVVSRALIGNLPAAYTLEPFYVFYDKYIYLQNRNIISYTLNLSESEKTQLLHVITAAYTKTETYSFIFNNCTDGLVTLLSQIDGLGLTSHVVNSPSDLVTKFDSLGVLSNKQVYRSIPEVQNSLYEQFSSSDKKSYRSFVTQDDKISFLDTLSADTQSSFSSILAASYYLQFRQNNTIPDDYVQVVEHTSENLPLASDESTTVIFNNSGYINLSYLNSENKDDFYSLTIRPLFSDIGEDYYSDYEQGSLELGKFSFRGSDNDLILTDITWVDVTSLRQMTQFQKKPSWSFSAKTEIEDEEDSFTIKTGYGYTIGTPTFYLYGFLGNSLEFTSMNYTSSVGFKLWFMEPEKFVFHYSFEQSFFDDGDFCWENQSTINFKYFLNDKFATTSEFSFTTKELSLGLNYYFNLI